jgi:energy-coupling factor transporter ATP-binding protein EcfA2
MGRALNGIALDDEDYVSTKKKIFKKIINYAFGECPYCCKDRFTSEFIGGVRKLNRHVFSVVGARGVGKTTLVNKLHEAIPSSSTMGGVINECPPEFYDKMPVDAAMWIAREHVRRLMLMLWSMRTQDDHIVICDGSEYDPFVYLSSSCHEASIYWKDILGDEGETKPYFHHIILIDNDKPNPSKGDLRAKKKLAFARKRVDFFQTFTIFFPDVMLVDVGTSVDMIVDWVRQRAFGSDTCSHGLRIEQYAS